MRYPSLILIVMCLPVGAADSPQRPQCTARNEGRFWPDEANDNPEFAKALMPYGYPEICTAVKGRYEWRSLTVSVSKLRQDASKKRPGPAKPNAAKKQDPADQRVTPEN